MINIVTSNNKKYEEIKTALLPLKSQQVSIELDEIQELDSIKIINHKILQAAKHLKSEFIVEDSLLYLSCLNNKLPGPFVKWFEKVFKLNEIYNLCSKLGNFNANAVSVIGYYKQGEIKIFRGASSGQVVKPKGSKDFGYGAIFQPLGYNQTYGQMDRSTKFKISHRAKAVLKLKKYLMSK